MSVKHAMLALLAAEPSSTYQLRKRFDASTGQGLPLNIGQVSSTMQRLERDGLVARDEAPHAGPASAGTDTGSPGSTGSPGGQLWRLCQAGRDELASWWASPVVAEERGRDELVLKLTLAAVTPGVDLPALLQTQRAATQRSMHDFTRIRRDTAADDIVARLVIDHHIFIAEAELRWIDDAEGALTRAAGRQRGAATGSATGSASGTSTTDSATGRASGTSTADSAFDAQARAAGTR